MKQYQLLIIAFIGGIFLAAQAGLNARLGVLLKNPLLAAGVTFFCSTILSFVFIVINAKKMPNWNEIEEVPFYLWFSGGLCSVIGISLYYYTIPKLGISTMISIGLFGQ